MRAGDTSSAGYFFTQRPFAILYQFLRIATAAIFLWSGLSKALAPERFADTVEAFGLLPPQQSMSVALLLIGAELIAGYGLLLEKKGALTAISLMMLLFIWVLGYGIHLGLDIDCGCFGPNDPEAQAFHGLKNALVRDLLIMTVILYQYLWRFSNKMTPRPWLSCNSKRGTKQGDRE